MNCNEKGVAIIKSFEGLRLEAYKCSSDRWSIGYGHAHNVKPGQKITTEFAEELFKEDLKIAEDAVKRLVKVPLTENEFSALTSLVFNVGQGELAKSRLLKHLNAGEKELAAEEFSKGWDTSNGKVELGLVRRRAAERNLFESD